MIQQQTKGMTRSLIVEARKQAEGAIGKTAPEVADALRWVTAAGTVENVSAVGMVIVPDGLLLTVTCEFKREGKVTSLEHVPITMARSPALLSHIQTQAEPIKEVVRAWSDRYRTITPKEIRAVMARAVNSPDGKVTTSAVRKHVVEPIGRVLPKHLQMAWSSWADSNPDAILTQIDSYPEIQEYRNEWPITALEHLHLVQSILAWVSDISNPLDVHKIARRRQHAPPAMVEEAKGTLLASLIPLTRLQDMQELWEGNWPSVATAPTMAMLLDILPPRLQGRSVDQLLDALASQPPPSASTSFFRIIDGETASTSARPQGDVGDRVGQQLQQAEREIARLKSVIDSSTQAIGEERFFQYLKPLMRLQQQAQTWVGSPPGVLEDSLTQINPQLFRPLRGHSKLLPSLVPLHTYSVVLGKVADPQTVTMLADCLTPPEVKTPAVLDILRTPEKAPKVTQGMDSKAPINVDQVEQRPTPPNSQAVLLSTLLQWVNSQLPESKEQQAKRLHMALFSAGVVPADFPMSDLPAQWQRLANAPHPPRWEKTVHEFLALAHKRGTPQGKGEAGAGGSAEPEQRQEVPCLSCRSSCLPRIHVRTVD